jgi:nucleotide-binding universal stress UspA family protein
VAFVTTKVPARLVDVARRANAQLLVLAERSGAATLLGTVSQHVLRKAPCPILIVPDLGPGKRSW